MAAPYTTPSGSDMSNLYNLFKFLTATTTNGAFMPVMLGVIWIVVLIGSISEGRQASRAFIYASFVCSLLAIVLALVALLNSQYMYFLFLLTGAGLIWYQLANAPGI